MRRGAAPAEDAVDDDSCIMGMGGGRWGGLGGTVTPPSPPKLPSSQQVRDAVDWLDQRSNRRTAVQFGKKLWAEIIQQSCVDF